MAEKRLFSDNSFFDKHKRLATLAAAAQRRDLQESELEAALQHAQQQQAIRRAMLALARKKDKPVNFLDQGEWENSRQAAVTIAVDARAALQRGVPGGAIGRALFIARRKAELRAVAPSRSVYDHIVRTMLGN